MILEMALILWGIHGLFASCAEKRERKQVVRQAKEKLAELECRLATNLAQEEQEAHVKGKIFAKKRTEIVRTVQKALDEKDQIIAEAYAKHQDYEMSMARLTEDSFQAQLNAYNLGAINKLRAIGDPNWRQYETECNMSTYCEVEQAACKTPWKIWNKSTGQWKELRPPRVHGAYE